MANISHTNAYKSPTIFTECYGRGLSKKLSPIIYELHKRVSQPWEGIIAATKLV